MKFIFSQMAYFVSQESNKRNMRFMMRFLVLVVVLITIYSIAFHYLMLLEDRSYSPITGLYWTLTVMSTLGFGDITFISDLGKIFSVVVLLSGIILLLVVMPFTFISFVYSPWLEAQSKARVPREMAQNYGGHVIIVGTNSIALSVVNILKRYKQAYVLLTQDHKEALELFDAAYSVMLGDLDTPETYTRLHTKRSCLVVALQDDLKNTNIVSTVREVASDVLIAGSVDHVDSIDILHLAGCNYVFNFSHMLGEAMGRRVFGTSTQSNIIGRFGDLCIAESAAHGTPLVGHTLRQLDLRGRLGLNVVGIWQGNEFMSASPDVAIDNGAVVLLAGSADLLDIYDQQMLMRTTASPEHKALILGGGRVGKEIARVLEMRGVPFKMVEKSAHKIPSGDARYVAGSAADMETLRRADINSISTVLVTTHDDNLNIYLTIYCRKLRPDAQIISRASLERNVASLYNAGANLVLSHSGLAANAIVNLLSPERFMLTEGLNIFKVPTPKKLVGIDLIRSGIRATTGCNVVAVHHSDGVDVNPLPTKPLPPESELILIGTEQAEQDFIKRFIGA